jgi:TP901 family phage tail tape measure protein
MYSINYLYSIIDKYSPVLDKMARAGQKFDRSVTRIQTSLGRMEDRFKSAGAKMANLQTGLASLGAGMFLKNALNEAVQYGDSIGRIGTLIPGQKDRLNSLKETIANVAVSVGSDMNDIAGGAFDVISAFGDMEGETEARLRAVVNASVAGGASSSAALSLLSAVTKSYGDTSGEALQKASDLAFMTNVLGQTTFPEMAASIGGVLPLSSKLAVTQEDVFAATAALTGVTGNTSAVMTQLASIMSSLIKPTDSMKKAITDAGFSSATAMIKAEGFAGTLDILKEATGGSEEMVGKLFGRKEAMTAFFALSGAQAGKFSEALEAMGEAAESNGQVTQDALNEMMDTPGFKLGQMTTGFQKLKIAMGDIVAEAITPLLDKFLPFVNSLKESNPQMLKMITYSLMFVTALGAILIPLGLFLSLIGSAIGAVKMIMGLTKLWTGIQVVFNAVMSANPIALVVIGIAALIAIIILAVKYWDNIVAAVKRAWTWIANFYEKIKGLIFLFGGPLGIAFVVVIELIKKIVQNWGKISAAFATFGEIVKTYFLVAVNWIVDGLKNIWDWFLKLLDSPFLAGILTYFAPWLTIPALIIKHWEPLKEFFVGLWEKVTGIVGKIAEFGGGIVNAIFGEGTLAQVMGTPPPRQAQAPTPAGGRRGANATADATISVYTEEGMGVKPYEPEGNLGYNMVATTSSRGRRR